MEAMLKDKIALITGASRGIGKGIALKFAQQGATILLVGRKMPGLEAAAEEIRALGGKADCFTADVAKEGDVTHLVDQVMAKYGRVDILVNNAGISKEMPLM